MGDIPTVAEILMALSAQWDDGGKEVMISILTKEEYERMEDCVNYIDYLAMKYIPPEKTSTT